jgi:hypothetical protein
MAGDEAPRPAPWSRLREGLVVALWTSFIAACCETAVVFACFDPITFGFEELVPSLAALRPIIYGVGFFAFWLFTFIGTGLTAYMLASGPNAAASAHGRPSRP